MHKKTPKVDIEDLFGDDITFEPDLFTEPDKAIPQNDTTTKAKGSSTSSDTTESSNTTTTKRRVSTAFKRSAKLNKHIYFVKPRLGSCPSKIHPLIRLRIWFTMIQLAKNGEDMKKVVELIPMLQEGGGAVPNLFAEEFVRKWYIPSHFTIKTI